MSVERICDQPKFKEELERIAAEQKRSLDDVLKEAKNCISELYADQNPLANIATFKGFEYMLSRAYEDTIDVDPQEVKRLMKLMRKNSVAFILTHKTYLDTVVLIHTLYRYGMPVPYFFGGINLAMPGIKQLGKSSGLIFLRRSFKDDPVYKVSLRHYIATLIDKGEHLTWNIEGTRSRTGKIVYPKMGILKYILEGEQESSREIKYVPVSIVYDLIPDVKEMTEEGKGKGKQSENLALFGRYLKNLGHKYGRASIRFGAPVDVSEHKNAIIPDDEDQSYADKNKLPRFAFELIHKANIITPVTTVSLVCNALLNNFALTKKEIEANVIKLMNYIGQRKEDVLIDRGSKVSVTVQRALNLLQGAHLIQKSKAGRKMQYSLAPNEYLSATYYANMSASHLYHRAFIEMALMKIKDDNSSHRIIHFWEEIMHLRNQFKFEFFYTNKSQFSSEIEHELQLFDRNWRTIIANPEGDIDNLLKKQELYVSKGLLLVYLEANKVVCHTLDSWDLEDDFIDSEFIDLCLFRGKELHWQSRISRLDSVSKPFLMSGLRFARNAKLIPSNGKLNYEGLNRWMSELEDLTDRLGQLQKLEIRAQKKATEKDQQEQESISRKVPGTNSNPIVKNFKDQEEGPHIAAFFDLDRTLINDFSAKKFVQSRLLSGKTKTKELLLQFATMLLYGAGTRDFEVLTKLSALGVRGIKEKEFTELGKQVYAKHLSETIYPESRELIKFHLEKGHQIVIISAATIYQVQPIADELGISNIYCTEMEVRKGRFTGRIETMCWGEGKADAGKKFAKEHHIDLSKSFFYTDSFDDYPLLEIVGKPHAVNPDTRLSQVAFENDWAILRFNENGGTPFINRFRTGLAAASFYPAILNGIVRGAFAMSQQEGINATIATLGDLGTKFAGLDIAVKGKQNLYDYRPAVFCFNHQSSADFFILSKLLRKDIAAVAKKELELSPFGPVFKALGAIFIDRSNKEKALKSMQHASEVIKTGISVVIAPEGTRSGSKELGTFKKGAFHLAMNAGVPIIPVVIKNAYMALPKGSSVFRPTHIEVVVLDPVDTSEWKKKHLDKHIEEVRHLFVKELEA